MATAEDSRKSEAGCHLEQLAATLEFLQKTDPRDLSKEEYTMLQDAILRFWVRENVRREFEGRLREVARDVRYFLTDVHWALEGIRSDVDLSRRNWFNRN